jgi:hypothetical protein
VLGLAGVGAMGAGAAWFFAAGDSLGAGDPAAMLGAAGLIATSGALLGAATLGLDADESDLTGEASTPVLRSGIGFGGAAWARERVASVGWLDVRPRINLGRLRITPGVTMRVQLGRAEDVDWRPQEEQTGARSLTSRARGVDLDVELRTRVIDDLDLIASPLVFTRTERFTYANGTDRRLTRTTVVPMALGFRWRISGRQYVESIGGPRWDHLAWRTPGESGDAAPLFYGPLFLSTRYRIQLAHPDVRGGLLRSRFGIGYIHSNFDGQGLNGGASIGFFGPLLLDWDTRWTPSRGPAIQVGIEAAVGDNGSIGIDIGLAPRGSAP